MFCLVLSISTWGLDLGDLIFTGDLFDIRNRAWLALHIAVLAVSLARGIRTASTHHRPCSRVSGHRRTAA